MAPPNGIKDRAIYHTILADMHRVQATMLNVQAIDNPDIAASLEEHFGRERSLALARLREWEQRRPDLYRLAGVDFRDLVSSADES